MKIFFIAVLLLAVTAASAETKSMDRLQALKGQVEAHTTSTVELLSLDQNALELVKKLETQLLRQVAEDKKNGVRVRGMKCSSKLNWAGAKALFEKNTNNGQGVKKYEEWLAEGATAATVYAEANASAAAVLGLSVGVGIAFEFAVTWAGNVPSFADAAVSLCAQGDFSIGAAIGANAGGTVYLVFGPITKLEESNLAVGGEVYSAIGGGIQVLLKVPGNVEEVKAAWTKAKEGLAAFSSSTAGTWFDKMKTLAKGTLKLAAATVIGVSFSAGVGAGISVAFSASFSVSDLIKKAIPAAFNDWAANTADSIKSKWAAFKAWVKN